MHIVRAGLRTGARLLVSTLLVIGLVGAVEPSVAVAATGRATVTETLNVRSGPGTRYPLLGTLPGGRTVTTSGTSGGWTKITYAGRTAYVSSGYLQAERTAAAPAVRAGSVRATTTAVNLRKGAGSSYPVLEVVAKGTRVTMTGRSSGGYAELFAGGTKGWASSRYLVASSGLPAVVGTRVATAALDIRTSSGAGSRTVSEVRKGTKLAITGVTRNGRAQVVYAGAARWVTARYLVRPTVVVPSAADLPKVTGTRYATAKLNVRSSSADSYTLITEVPRGTKLSITGVVKNGRMQIIWSGAARWVTARYLSTTKPSTAPAPGSSAVERGLKPNAIKVHRAALARFPRITTYYGVRPDSIPDHPSGRALDLMIPGYSTASGKALGSEVAAWARANAGSLGIQYVIWNQRIWNVQRNSEGWRYMADRGGDSANHKNHVHVTVFG